MINRGLGYLHNASMIRVNLEIPVIVFFSVKNVLANDLTSMKFNSQKVETELE